jgi:hypothetical protein
MTNLELSDGSYVEDMFSSADFKSTDPDAKFDRMSVISMTEKVSSLGVELMTGIVLITKDTKQQLDDSVDKDSRLMPTDKQFPVEMFMDNATYETAK